MRASRELQAIDTSSDLCIAGRSRSIAVPVRPGIMFRVDESTLRADAHRTLGELVAGLDEVAASAIPYARLPTRAGNAYAAEFVCWADIAGQTVDSLLSRPWAGVATVRALLHAAEDTVAKQRAAATAKPVGAAAAVRRLLDDLDERDRVMVAARLWAPGPSHADLAQRFGVAKVWVQRHQPRAVARFTELLADPIHHEVGQHAADLARRLGPYVPDDVVAAELRRLDVDPSSHAAGVLLHVAGPYARRGDWWENAKTDGAQHIAATVDGVFTRCPAPSTGSLLHALIVENMPLDVATRYLGTRADWRRFGDQWVRWGDSAASKAEAVLHVRSAPATVDDIVTAIGPGPTSVNAIREALYADPRFVRASRQTWGLRGWGIDEYAGISKEVSARIDAAGGTIGVEELIEDMLARFADVAEGSIRTNLTSSLAFITDGVTVRRRTERDEWPAIPPLRTARGAFRNGPNEIRVAMPVSDDILRGSGQPIHPAIAAALAVSPGERRTFTSPHGQVAVIWRLSSTNGPTIGSIRASAKAVGAAFGDEIVLAFRLDDATLDVTRIASEVSGVARLRLLLGRTVRNTGVALAASLDCRRADVVAALRNRGEPDLADLV